ncbi:MAG TPA: metal ABC transporter substrate-binding protein [bacterium]|nr:metal ABC transporter substrate-binding protein [bacterium]
MKKILWLLTSLLFLAGSEAYAKLTVAASLPDLASIAAYVGGDRVSAFSIARPNADPHSVEVLPSYMVRVSRADVYLKVGMSLDQWADQIIDGSRNGRIRIVDCSNGIAVLEKPGKVDASLGDVHPEGNPHYWLDPENGMLVAQTIADALTAADPSGAATYSANLDRFKAEVTRKMAVWKVTAAAIPNRTILTYHSSWPYFAQAFGFTIPAHIEPIPGIPPNAGHLAHLVKIIKEQQVTAVISEPYYSDDAANFLARETGVKLFKITPSCADASPNSYLDHFQQIFDALKGN